MHPPRARSQAPNYRAQFDHVSYSERGGSERRRGRPRPAKQKTQKQLRKKNFDKTATDEEGLREVERERESVRKRRKGKKEEEEEPNQRTSLPAAVLFTRELGAADEICRTHETDERGLGGISQRLKRPQNMKEIELHASSCDS